jgi:hypothetical protein
MSIKGDFHRLLFPFRHFNLNRVLMASPPSVLHALHTSNSLYLLIGFPHARGPFSPGITLTHRRPALKGYRGEASAIWAGSILIPTESLISEGSSNILIPAFLNSLSNLAFGSMFTSSNVKKLGSHNASKIIRFCQYPLEWQWLASIKSVIFKKWQRQIKNHLFLRYWMAGDSARKKLAIL